MALQTHSYLIGYNGLIPQYCEIRVPCEDIEIKPLSLKVSKNLNNLIKMQSYLKDKARKMIGIPQKRSNNYEGINENYKR